MKSKGMPYKDLEGDMHDKFMESINPIRSWFHVSRFKLIEKEVLACYKERYKIVDLGSGSCGWNVLYKFPVIGFDINKKALKYGLGKKRLSQLCVGHILYLPFKNRSVDIVIAAEILEHLENYEKAIKEIKRVLKSNGKAIITVPYDTNLSFWKPLFTVHCFIQGYIFGKEYFKHNAGHINHFSPKEIVEIFTENGFKIDKHINNYYFTILTTVTPK